MARRRALGVSSAQINITIHRKAATVAAEIAAEYNETRSEVWRHALGEPMSALDRARRSLAKRARAEAREDGR